MSQPFLVPQLITVIYYETNLPGIDLNYLQINAPHLKMKDLSSS